MGARRRRSSIDLQRVHARVERWRATRTKRSPMPEALWKSAVALARSEGLYPVARDLGLNYENLKARVAAGSSRSSKRVAPVPAGFVELPPPVAVSAVAPSGPVLEWVDRAGAKLTIRLPAEQEVDVERLAARFLRGGRR